MFDGRTSAARTLTITLKRFHLWAGKSHFITCLHKDNQVMLMHGKFIIVSWMSREKTCMDDSSS